MLLARARDHAFQVVAIRQEGQRHALRQLGDGVGGVGGAGAEPADHQRDTRCVRLAGQRLHLARECVGRPRSVGSDARNRAVARDFGEALIGRSRCRRRCRRRCGRHRTGGAAGDDHVLALAARSIDDGDRGAVGRCAGCGRDCVRSVIAVRAFGLVRRFRIGGLARCRVGTQIGRDDAERLAAERVVEHHRGDREGARGAGQQAGERLRDQGRHLAALTPRPKAAERNIQIINRHRRDPFESYRDASAKVVNRSFTVTADVGCRISKNKTGRPKPPRLIAESRTVSSPWWSAAWPNSL